MERKWRRTGLRADLEQLKAIRCKYTHELNESKSQHINKLIIDCEHDPKKVFQLVSNLTGSKVENPLPEGHTNKDLADSFADFFIGKIEKIRNELAQYPKYVPIESDSDEFSDFVPLNEVDIRKIITKSKSTGCELDPLGRFYNQVCKSVSRSSKIEFIFFPFLSFAMIVYDFGLINPNFGTYKIFRFLIM